MRIVFLGPTRSSFANVDIGILQEEHEVLVRDTVLGHGWRGVRSLILLTVWVLRTLPASDALYCWFADYHTLVPSLYARLLRKRIVIVAGGYDIGYEPQINFGARIKPLRWFCVRSSFRLAHRVLAVSSYAKEQLFKLIPGFDRPVTVVYNAVRTDILSAEEAIGERQPMAMMISQGDSDVEIKRKGVDVFVAIAEATPDFEFRLIGLAAGHPMVREASLRSPNLKLYPGFVSYEDIIVPTFKQASAYLQPSVEEAFGVAVVEGMSCGCIPVVSPAAALPEVVGSAGRYCRTLKEFQSEVRATISATSNDRQQVRTHAEQYSRPRRRDAVLTAVRQLQVS